MIAVADAVILSTGWLRRLIAFAAGAVGALALAPFNVAPALVVTMVVAVWLLDGASDVRSRRWVAWPGVGSLRLAFSSGWWLGFGYFLAGLWWLGAAFLTDPEFVWALPLGVLGVPALLALFTGAGFVLARLCWSSGVARILALALALGISEWCRGHLLSGFPWNAFGMALGDHLVPAQFAAIVGLDGLTLVTIAIFAMPATLADGQSAGGMTWRPTVVAIGGLAVIFAFGAFRLANGTSRDVPNVVVRIMQPGLIANDRFTSEHKDEIVAHYIELSKREDPAKHIKLSDVTMLVWPESAFPFILTRDPQELAVIGAFLPPKTSLVTGAAREEEVPGDETHRSFSNYFNAIDVIERGGTIIDSYDKVHLVPFGEYLPLDRILRRLGLRNFVSVPGGFEPGYVRRALNVPRIPPMTPLICYEAIFPGAVDLIPQKGVERPKAFLNITNDGWFGTTAGPSQHFAQARLRTIEEGLPMVRGAATGVSAIVDAYGRILGQIPLGTEGILDGKLPEPIASPVFARVGTTIVFAVWLITFAAWLALRALRR